MRTKIFLMEALSENSRVIDEKEIAFISWRILFILGYYSKLLILSGFLVVFLRVIKNSFSRFLSRKRIRYIFRLYF